ncbi:MAG: acyl-CoA thioesterase [Phormidesmis sp.]
MHFVYRRVIRFQETDAAGVVYFANLLSLCHEAYEASLAESGIDLKRFFSGSGEAAVPIVHAEADFYQPLFCGDAIAIALTPQQLNPQSFEVTYAITAQADTKAKKKGQTLLAKALTRHVCISLRDEASAASAVRAADAPNRRRRVLTAALVDWIEGFAELAD